MSGGSGATLRRLGADDADAFRALRVEGARLQPHQFRFDPHDEAAVPLYERAGFRAYGVEPRSVRVGDRYVDEVLMALPLGADV